MLVAFFFLVCKSQTLRSKMHFFNVPSYDANSIMASGVKNKSAWRYIFIIIIRECKKRCIQSWVKKKYNIKYNYKHKLISTLEEVMVAGSGSLLFFVIFFKYGEGK